MPAAQFMAVFGPYAARISQVLDRFDPSGLAAAAQMVAGVRDVLSGAPDLPAEVSVTVGNAAFLLLDASNTADLVVVGSRGLGGFRGALAGSTGPQLAGHTGCPLVVVRDLPGTRWVRASCGWWTNEDDIDRLVSGLGV